MPMNRIAAWPGGRLGGRRLIEPEQPVGSKQQLLPRNSGPAGRLLDPRHAWASGETHQDQTGLTRGNDSASEASARFPNAFPTGLSQWPGTAKPVNRPQFMC
jgi:hypothetical protein